MRKLRIFLALGIISTLPASAFADNIIYKYDSLGRLIQAFNANSGFRDQYKLDAADNRTTVGVRNVLINLQANQSISSPDNRFHLTMQTDGNLVLSGPSGNLWASNTSGTGATFAAMQGDGNLVVYTPSLQPKWASGTSGNLASTLDLQSDGNLVIYSDAGTALWATGTGGH